MCIVYKIVSQTIVIWGHVNDYLRMTLPLHCASTPRYYACSEAEEAGSIPVSCSTSEKPRSHAACEAFSFAPFCGFSSSGGKMSRYYHAIMLVL